MQLAHPPFRADVVGSLLRPSPVKDARQQQQAGNLDADRLRSVENEAIRHAVACQCQAGLQVVTDGEFRRAWWHFDFFEGLQGVEGYDADQGIQFNGVQTRSRNVRVTGKLGFGQHPMLEHFRFLQSVTDGVTAKMTIPSPSVLHFRGGRNVVSVEAYPNLDDFFDDLARVYKEALQAFYDAGCRYLQLDDTVWAYLCSEEQTAKIVERGEDPQQLQRTYSRVINKALEGKPDDLVVSMHVCRGNFRSTWISEGGYEPVAEVLFGSVNVDAFFLEYDTDRAGGFEPLRFIRPGHQKVVLGLVTSKTGELESVEDVKARIHEAAQFVDLDQLCLSTQCGFASTEEGNTLSEAQQQAKLELVVQIAKDVWGE
ncbi:cobalamin-independent methionine synthase II family protein [Halomonas elongata]|uniref:cobalamin-independent methionine synthase II family protein n=1 Tax=Halomonas elongata TaxID=2746 RepID=UPI000DCB7979|nr:cobalamin-independent methionine synthase II family protein [Halomonas elongata]MDL4863813.1 cobalamin-independent methionine synthase II family protein [Halomonas elongata]RAW07083.1 5-methyltetrahydropteroyltriglutamate--homocysteine S-methyltransferase [Halomonas elongata]